MAQAAASPLNARALGGSSRCSLGASDEIPDVHADVARDGSKKGRRDVSALVEGDRRYATIGMSILAVRTTLADLNESETREDGDDFPRLENGDVTHRLGDLDRLRSNELAVELGRAILKQHGDDFFKVLVEFVERGALGVRTRPPGDIAHEQPCGLVALDDRREALHVERIPREGPPNKPLQHSSRSPP